MGLGVGIVGLPNVGKSTTFNALTKAQNAESANYPFCTIEPNKAVVPVPDYRLDKLAEIVNPKRIQNSTIDFVDIAGLVRGASKGEGLGNQFLSNIRECEIILHLVRCFDDENITHVENSIDPVRDVKIIEDELLFADLESLNKKVEKLSKQTRIDKEAAAMYELAKDLFEFMEEGNPASKYHDKENDLFITLDREMRFLSNKAMLYGANVDEDGLLIDNEYVQQLASHAVLNDIPLIKQCAKIEEELAGLEEDEREEFLSELGILESGLDVIIRRSFEKLGLLSYFTAGVQEVRAWTIKNGWKAPKSASVIHNDFEKGFIRAEVISYNDFTLNQGEQGAKDAGKMRVEGKEYIVQDGDVMHFRFNV
ncbi:MAG: redox-regulated ATPase YchF [Melioribacteraceae bacterium]|nr:redox-regulated ATPase YchF [Melioribacteraceae bacterium]